MATILDSWPTGMEKINFSGGEPLIHKKGEFVGELVRYCKDSLELPSVSIVSNGSLITEDWFDKYGEQYIYLLKLYIMHNQRFLYAPNI